jgi:hypothetical protein
MTTDTSPSMIMWKPTPDSPCLAMSLPGGNVTSLAIAATRWSSLSLNPENSGTLLM